MPAPPTAHPDIDPDPIFAVIAEYDRIRSAWFALPCETVEEEERPAFQEGMADTSTAADVVCAIAPTTYAGGQRKAEFYLQYIGGSIIPADVLEEIVAFFKLPRVATTLNQDDGPDAG